jgi:hypothetical protein
MNWLFRARVWDDQGMRYLNLTMILASTVTLMLACGDDGGTDAADETAGTGTASETTNEAGDGDGDGDGGDGDGDGDGGDGDGDGDAGDGDGDGDGGDGDGDGDGGDGDGDGDGGDGDGDTGTDCEPANDSPCAVCSAENCCDEITACQEDEDCGCLSDCLAQGTEVIECGQMCGLNPNQLMDPLLMAIRECNMQNCMQECAMP